MSPPVPTLEGEWLHLAFVVVILLGVYTASTPRTVTLEDSGFFIMSCHAAGISHPPGYPLHSVLGKLFTLIPIGSVAMRVHLLSALFGALSAATVWWIVRMLTDSRGGAWAAALAFGLSREFWAQAIIAEVYSMNAFFYFVLIALCLDYRARGRERTLLFIAWVGGLGVSHHWPLIVLGSAAPAALIWPRRRQALAALPRALPLFALGLLPWVYMVVRSWGNPEISFYGPIESWDQLYLVLSRRGYSDIDADAGAGWSDKLGFAGFFVRELAAQMTPLGILVASFGAYVQQRRVRAVALALFLGFVGPSLMLILLLRRDYDFLQMAVFKVYPLTSYGIAAIWLGEGVAELACLAAARWGRRAALFGPGLAGTLAVLCCAMHARVNLRSDYRWAHQYAEAVLTALPPNAILVTHGDADTGPIGYLHRVLGVRPDVTLYNEKGLIFSNRLFPALTPAVQRAAAFRDLVQRTDRPVCSTGRLDLPFGTVDFSVYTQIDKTSPAGTAAVSTRTPLLDYLDRILAQTDHTDMWTVDHRNLLLFSFARTLTQMTQSPDVHPRIRATIAALEGYAPARIGIIEALAPSEDPARVLAMIHETEGALDASISRQLRGILAYLKGFVLTRSGENDAAIESFGQSIELYPSAENGSVLGSLQHFAGKADRPGYWTLRRRFWAGATPPPAVRDLDARMR